MSILNSLIDSADPIGLAIYVPAMAFLLGTVALANHRDLVVAARKSQKSYAMGL
jgi:hypothetical protein